MARWKISIGGHNKEGDCLGVLEFRGNSYKFDSIVFDRALEQISNNTQGNYLLIDTKGAINNIMSEDTLKDMELEYTQESIEDIYGTKRLSSRFPRLFKSLFSNNSNNEICFYSPEKILDTSSYITNGIHRLYLFSQLSLPCFPLFVTPESELILRKRFNQIIL